MDDKITKQEVAQQEQQEQKVTKQKDPKKIEAGKKGH